MVEFDLGAFEMRRSLDTASHQFADEQVQPVRPDRPLHTGGLWVLDLDIGFDAAAAIDSAAKIGAANIILRLLCRFGIPIGVAMEMVFVARTVRIIPLNQ